MTVPLKIFEGSKEDYFEEVEKGHVETYYLNPGFGLEKMFGD